MIDDDLLDAPLMSDDLESFLRLLLVSARESFPLVDLLTGGGDRESGDRFRLAADDDPGRPSGECPVVLDSVTFS